MGSFSRRMKKKSIASFRRDELRKDIADIKACFDVARVTHKQRRYDLETRGNVADYLALAWAYVLNRDCHYGMARLTRLFKHVVEFVDEIHTNWSPLPEWEQALKKEAGFTVKHLDKEPFTHDERVTMSELERQTVIYSCALFVEYNFHGKRLQRCVDSVANIIRQLQYNKYTFEELGSLLAKKKIDMAKISADAKERWHHEKKELQSKRHSLQAVSGFSQGYGRQCAI